MKKLLILALALTMAFSMALTVSAETIVAGGSLAQTSANPVDIKITVNGSVVDQYAFDIVYGSMIFQYGAALEWNPETYEYEPDDGKDGTWSAPNSGDKITVINHSNQPIYTAAKVESATTAYGDLVLKVSEGGMIEGCEVGDEKDSNNLVMTVSIEGSPIVSTATEQKIGSVVVTVSQNPITNQ